MTEDDLDLEGDLDMNELPKDELNSLLKKNHSRGTPSIYESSLAEFLSKEEIDILLAGGIPKSCQIVAIFKEGNSTENSKASKDS